MLRVGAACYCLSLITCWCTMCTIVLMVCCWRMMIVIIIITYKRRNQKSLFPSYLFPSCRYSKQPRDIFTFSSQRSFLLYECTWYFLVASSENYQTKFCLWIAHSRVRISAQDPHRAAWGAADYRCEHCTNKVK